MISKTKTVQYFKYYLFFVVVVSSMAYYQNTSFLKDCLLVFVHIRLLGVNLCEILVPYMLSVVSLTRCLVTGHLVYLTNIATNTSG